MPHPIEQLEAIMAQLRDPIKGCPWDKKQTFDSIIPYTLEEVYELRQGVVEQDWHNVKEELGDLLYHVVFFSQMAKEQDLFDLSDVIDQVNEKMTRRHPHVFSNAAFESDAELNQNWQDQKNHEKAQKQPSQCLNLNSNSILTDLATHLPALQQAESIQRQCAHYGFDWPQASEVLLKIHEETNEVGDELQKKPLDSEAVELELGDLLFSVVNLARHLNQSPELALAKSTAKFIRRFQQLETLIQTKGDTLENMSLDELNLAWAQVKQLNCSVKN